MIRRDVSAKEEPLNCPIPTIESKPSSAGTGKMPFVNSDGPMPSVIRSERRKSELWSEFKKEFAGIGIADRTIDSLALIPLIETALDDGAISQDEKEIILFVMKNIRLLTSGIDPKLNDLWIPFKGRTEFLIVWTVYLRDLSRQMPSGEKITLKALIIESCKFMSRTIGGFLKVHDLENRIMNAIENAFTFETKPYRKRQEPSFMSESPSPKQEHQDAKQQQS
jgi:hypothetical protein